MKTKQTPTKIQNTRYLNDTLTQNCESLFKDHLSDSQMKLVVLICAGIFLAKSIQLQDIAQHIPGTQKLLSIISRISRFLKNSKIPVRETYESIIKPILKSYAKGAHLRLIIDGSKVGFGYQLLVVGLAYKHRAIPLAWTWIRGKLKSLWLAIANLAQLKLYNGLEAIAGCMCYAKRAAPIIVSAKSGLNG